MKEISCKSCKFWDVIKDSPGGAAGLCRRYAPRSVGMNPLGEITNLDTTWPRTRPDDWCGQWDKRVEIESSNQ